MKFQNELKWVLLTVTLVMTAKFGWSLSSGLSSLFFAITLVTVQAASLLCLPVFIRDALSREMYFNVVLYSMIVALVILTSIVASVAMLSQSEDREYLDKQARSTLQAAIDGYMAEGYITKALMVKKQLDELQVVEKTALQSAAERVGNVTGWTSNSVTNGFIILLALLLDVMVVILGGKQQSVIHKIPDQVTGNNNSDYVLVDDKPEVRTVINALNEGSIKRLSVREVRALLNCSQRKAQDISNTCKQLQLQLTG